MKSKAFNIITDPNYNHSFLVKRCKDPNLFVPLHFHYNFELMAILSGEGTRFIGDNVSSFGPGDLVMIGKELPHVWLNNKEYYENRKDLFSELIVMNFEDSLSGFEFFQLPEFTAIRALMLRAARGIVFKGKTQVKVIEQLKQLAEMQGFPRFILFLQILDVLAASSEYELISGVSVKQKKTDSDPDRIGKIYDFIMRHYHENIDEETVASHIGMNPSSFSRYFKSKSYKNFSVFLNEVRISHASKMILEDKISVSEIAYLCGYSSISNFNRQFKRIKKATPLEFKKIYQEKIEK